MCDDDERTCGLCCLGFIVFAGVVVVITGGVGLATLPPVNTRPTTCTVAEFLPPKEIIGTCTFSETRECPQPCCSPCDCDNDGCGSCCAPCDCEVEVPYTCSAPVWTFEYPTPGGELCSDVESVQFAGEPQHASSGRCPDESPPSAECAEETSRELAILALEDRPVGTTFECFYDSKTCGGVRLTAPRSEKAGWTTALIVGGAILGVGLALTFAIGLASRSANCLGACCECLERGCGGCASCCASTGRFATTHLWRAVSHLCCLDAPAYDAPPRDAGADPRARGPAGPEDPRARGPAPAAAVYGARYQHPVGGAADERWHISFHPPGEPRRPVMDVTDAFDMINADKRPPEEMPPSWKSESSLESPPAF